MNGWRRRLIWAGLGLVFLTSLYIVTALGLWYCYSGKIRPGVSIAGTEYVGWSDEEIMADLEERTSAFLEQGNPYQVQYDIAATLEEAKKAIDEPFPLGQKRDVPVVHNFNQDLLAKDLAASQRTTTKSVANPVIVKQGGELVVKKGSPGSRVLYGENTRRFMEMTGALVSGFRVVGSEIAPAYTEGELEGSLVLARQLSLSGLVLKYADQNYTVPEEEIASWVSLKSKNSSLAPRLGGEWSAVFARDEAGVSIFDGGRVEGYLATIAQKIDRDPVNAALRMQDGKATVFSLSQTGLSLNLSSSVVKIIEALNSEKTEATLVVDEVQPEITQNSLATLGIVELVSEGRSNFAGSPANRRHNIRVGASRFDGLIIKPNETFSFTKTLGAVDASTGYLPELVIKANGTVPEYGGGLCQVSSTAFRAALNAALPITARKAHAYPVTYYKPYGTDATIYIPNPDLKFVNDTGHHILVQTRIVGNYLYFDFYGTKKSTTVKFAGNKNGVGAVTRIEDVKPLIYDSGVRGEGSFTAVFWQFLYDATGKLIRTDDFVSKYDSPLKYPH